MKKLLNDGRNMLVNCCVNQMRDLYHPMDADSAPNRELLGIIREWREFLDGIGYKGRFMMMALRAGDSVSALNSEMATAMAMVSPNCL